MLLSKSTISSVWLTIPKTLLFIIAELQTMNKGVTSPETISKLFTSKAKTSLQDLSYLKRAAFQHAQLHNDRVVMRPFPSTWPLVYRYWQLCTAGSHSHGHVCEKVRGKARRTVRKKDVDVNVPKTVCQSLKYLLAVVCVCNRDALCQISLFASESQHFLATVS